MRHLVRELRQPRANPALRPRPHPTSGALEWSQGHPGNRSGSWHGTTILTVRKGGMVVIGGDGQVSIGQTIVKANAKKVRRSAKAT